MAIDIHRSKAIDHAGHSKLACQKIYYGYIYNGYIEAIAGSHNSPLRQPYLIKFLLYENDDEHCL